MAVPGTTGGPDGGGHSPSPSSPLAALLDAVAVAAGASGRGVLPRIKWSPAGLLRGETDVVVLEVPGLSLADLVVDRFIVRAERVRIRPGFPPTLLATPVGLRAVVTQASIDRWSSRRRLPFRFRLTADGVVTSTVIGGVTIGEILTMPEVGDGFLRLKPVRASMMGLPAPLVQFLRGYLPLPPLPRDAVLESVEPGIGTLTVTLRIDHFEQDLTPDIQQQFASVLQWPFGRR